MIIECLEADAEEAARYTAEVMEDCTRYAYERTELMLKGGSNRGDC
jgi:hypothetical protein